MKAKYIPVNNNLDKAIAFANTLDSNNIKNIQKLKQPQHYIETLDVVKMLQNEGWELSGVDEFRNKQRKVTSHYLQLHHNDFQIVTKGKTEDDMWQMDYARLTPYLVKAIQELKAEFDAYKATHP